MVMWGLTSGMLILVIRSLIGPKTSSTIKRSKQNLQLARSITPSTTIRRSPRVRSPAVLIPLLILIITPLSLGIPVAIGVFDDVFEITILYGRMARYMKRIRREYKNIPFVIVPM